MTDEWLTSRLKLCQLTTDPKTDTSNVWDPVEVELNTQSYPQPDYDQSSIFFTLEAYSSGLDELRHGRCDLKMESRCQHLESKPVQTVQAHNIQEFAEMLSRDILDTTVRRRDNQSNKDGMMIHPDKICNVTDHSEVTKWTISNQEKLAKRLAFEIYGNALEEVARHSGLAGGKSEELSDVQTDEKDGISDLHSEPCSSMYCCDQEQPDMEVDPKPERNESTHNHERPFHEPCSTVRQSDFTTYSSTLNNMANMGSLDYPDAPPTTPLLPEMMKSRASFSRKLKGGLAKEFLPSTPPPTPKDQQSLSGDKMTETAADKSEFMVRLMRSLSLACSQHGDLDEEQDGIGPDDGGRFQNGISKLSDYAAQLSADIINCIATAQPSTTNINRETPVRDVQHLANHLAEEIIIISVAEMMESKRVGRKGEQNSHLSYSVDEMESCLETSTEKTTQALGDTLLARSSPDVSDMEALRALAGRLIASTLAQAFSELGRGALQHATSQQFLGETSEPKPSEERKVQDHNLCLNTTKSKQTTSIECSNGESVHDCSMLDSRTETAIDEYCLAEKIAHEVLECSIKEASNYLLSCSQLAVDSERLHSPVASLESTEQAVLRGLISDELCQDMKELQCVLIWAAASHAGISVLQLVVPDNHVRQQLGSLSLKAQFHGWTVGNLMTSLLQYCEDLQTASRGHRKSDRSLLGHLLF
ncbi:uncharacterized protein si:dkey-171c9.3 [Colossoma macropomum]|uniref:uncharacterized protein si:dkey-171c9.3 n=1 Tax=Colossoma macropomum TaxID=42526 RepID=UPI0018655339|nr:uncharacterized protein si:dkey-171c9.3 [Colossoma macropomum]